MADTTTEPRAKYTQADRDQMAQSGEAMSDGSYPIKDEADLKRAIRAVGRGNADHDNVRAHVIKRAKALGLSALVPDNWNTDGSLKETNGAWSTLEERESANDMFTALQGAVEDVLDGQFSSWSVWVQDWTADEKVIYMAGGDLYAAPYTFYADGAITIGDAVKVRPVTEYVERSANGDDRPLLEWRKRKAADCRGLERREFSLVDVELREKDDETWNLTGYASVTETPYDVGFYTETIKRGAFKRTLSENPDVQLLVNHEGLPLARTRSGTLRLEERERGLWVDADLDKRDPDAQRLERKMARGDIDQMSFAFQATDQEWNEDYTQRSIKNVSIHRGDVSVVNQGANAASTASIRTQDALRALHRHGGDAFVAMFRELRDHTLLPVEERAGKTLSAASMEVLTNVLNLVAAADDAVDEAQPLLAELMGVPNPDNDDNEPDDDDSAAGEVDTSDDDATTATRSAAPTRFTTTAAEQLALMRAGRGR